MRPNIFRCPLPKELSISRSEIFKKRKEKGTKYKKILGKVKKTGKKLINVSFGLTCIHTQTTVGENTNISL